MCVKCLLLQWPYNMDLVMPPSQVATAVNPPPGQPLQVPIFSQVGKLICQDVLTAVAGDESGTCWSPWSVLILLSKVTQDHRKPKITNLINHCLESKPVPFLVAV